MKCRGPRRLGDRTELFNPTPITHGCAAPVREFTTEQLVDKGHRRLETQVLTTRSVLTSYSDWPQLVPLFKIRATAC